MKLNRILIETKREMKKRESGSPLSVYAIPEVKTMNKKRFIQKVCTDLGVNPINVMKKRGTMDESDVRHIIRYFLRHAFKMNLREIGLQTGNVNHSAVCNSINECENLKATSESFRIRFDHVFKMLEKHGVLK
jgi:chromosomal replication initiation ATPase DnaA